MKYIRLVVGLLLLLTISFAHSQNHNNSIHLVTIFKWSKSGNLENKKVLLIDSAGNIFLDNADVAQQVNMISFTSAINDFVQKEKAEKIDASDDPPREVFGPGNNKQCIFITISYSKDYYAENKFITKTEYSWQAKDLDKDDNNYTLYKYLDKKDLLIIKKLLANNTGGGNGEAPPAVHNDR